MGYQTRNLQKLPPSVHTSLHPDDIVGPVVVGTLTDFIATTHKLEAGSYEGVVNKKFKPNTRANIAEVLKKCRGIGWYPDGLDQHNRIRWRQRVDHRADHLEWQKLENAPTPTRQEIEKMRQDYWAKQERFNDSVMINAVHSWELDE